MKVNITDEIDRNSLLSHFILEMDTPTIQKIVKKIRGKKPRSIDVQMTVEGYSVDVNKTMKHIESQLENLIEKRAKKLFTERYESIITDKLEQIGDIADDLKERLDNEVDKRKEDWEKD